MPARSVGELIAYARANPGKLNLQSAEARTGRRKRGQARIMITRADKQRASFARIRAWPLFPSALAATGAEAVTASPEAFAALQQRDRERFGVFVREANIRAD